MKSLVAEWIVMVISSLEAAERERDELKANCAITCKFLLNEARSHFDNEKILREMDRKKFETELAALRRVAEAARREKRWNCWRPVDDVERQQAKKDYDELTEALAALCEIENEMSWL